MVQCAKKAIKANNVNQFSRELAACFGNEKLLVAQKNLSVKYIENLFGGEGFYFF